MHIESRHLDIVLSVLQQYVSAYAVWAFGSRVHGRTLKKFSDLDLAVMTEKRLPGLLLADLKEAFDESTLPFRVDVLDWSRVSEDFRKIIEENYEVIHRPKT